ASLVFMRLARKRRGDTQLLSQCLRATSCYTLRCRKPVTLPSRNSILGTAAVGAPHDSRLPLDSCSETNPQPSGRGDVNKVVVCVSHQRLPVSRTTFGASVTRR